MKNPVFLTDRQKFDMAEMYKRGSSLRECAHFFNVDRSTAHPWIRRTGVQMRDANIARRIYSHNEAVFDTISTPKQAYWLGFLLADGCVTIPQEGAKVLTVALQERDVEHLEQLRDFLGYTGPLRQEPKTNSARLSVKSNRLCDALIKHGCTPRKGNYLEYPPEGLLHRSHFIRGYFDGDGCISIYHKAYSQPTVSFVGTETFLTGLREVLQIDAGMPLVKIVHHAKSVACYLRWTGRGNARRLHDYLYEDATICLERKKRVFEEALAYETVRQQVRLGVRAWR